jgi:ERCC4-type nuclease
MKITINIDYREKRIIDTITARLTSQPVAHISTATPNLEVGDIHILAIGDLGQVQAQLIIERKTLSDMVASVKDGRYKEQKLRLDTTATGLPHPTRYVYMLEGTSHTTPKDLPQLFGAWISSQFRDDIPVIRTVSVEESCDFIMRLCDRMYKNFAELFPQCRNQTSAVTTTKTVTLTGGGSPVIVSAPERGVESGGDVRTVQVAGSGYLEAAVGGIKTKKKDNLTPALCQQLMICNIPGVSSTLAVPIMEHFGSLANMVKYLADETQTVEEKKKVIGGIQLASQTSTGKNRTVGPVVASKIIEYLTIA